MALHWGVDSYSPANTMVRIPAAHREAGESAGTRLSIFDYVTRRMGRAPEFWGRYLNADPRAAERRLRAGGTTSQMLLPERGFLRDHGCKVLLVYNGPHRRTRSLAGGRAAARRACALAHDLGVPPGVRIYADLENWQVPERWFRGWIEEMLTSRYRGGAYGRPAQVVENPRSPSRHYGPHINNIPSRWTRDRARQLIDEQSSPAWFPRRVVTREFWGDDLSRALAARRAAATRRVGSLARGAILSANFYIWSNGPRRVFSSATRDARLDGTDIPTEFVPSQPIIHEGTHTAVWQYLENCIWAERGRRGLVDMNLSDEFGFRDMWLPS